MSGEYASSVQCDWHTINFLRNAIVNVEVVVSSLHSRWAAVEPHKLFNFNDAQIVCR